jgi:hypothetical protein
MLNDLSFQCAACCEWAVLSSEERKAQKEEVNQKIHLYDITAESEGVRFGTRKELEEFLSRGNESPDFVAPTFCGAHLYDEEEDPNNYLPASQVMRDDDGENAVISDAEDAEDSVDEESEDLDDSSSDSSDSSK